MRSPWQRIMWVGYDGLMLLWVPLHFIKDLFRRKWREIDGAFWLAKYGIGIPCKFERNGPVFWIHGVSVGETKAGEILLREIRARHPDVTCICSAVTPDGNNELRAMKTGPDQIVPLPCDARPIARRFIKKIRPDAFIIIDGDYWPGFINEATANGCKVFVVNGKLSGRSAKRYPLLQMCLGDVFGRVEHFYMQSQNYVERFSGLGIAAEKMTVVGNIKMEELIRPQGEAVKSEVAASQILTVTFGSIHPDELQHLVPAIRQLLEKSSLFRAIIVPRHPGKFNAEKVKNIFGGENVDYRESFSIRDAGSRIVWINALGVLKQVYAISDVAFVGGTYNKVGGHNLVEPALYGIPVLFGPNTSGQSALREVVDRYHLGREVKSAQGLGEAIHGFKAEWKTGEVAKSVKNLRRDHVGLAARIIGEIRQKCQIRSGTAGRGGV